MATSLQGPCANASSAAQQWLSVCCAGEPGPRLMIWVASSPSTGWSWASPVQLQAVRQCVWYPCCSAHSGTCRGLSCQVTSQGLSFPTIKLKPAPRLALIPLSSRACCHCRHGSHSRLSLLLFFSPPARPVLPKVGKEEDAQEKSLLELEWQHQERRHRRVPSSLSHQLHSPRRSAQAAHSLDISLSTPALNSDAGLIFIYSIFISKFGLVSNYRLY